MILRWPEGGARGPEALPGSLHSQEQGLPAASPRKPVPTLSQGTRPLRSSPKHAREHARVERVRVGAVLPPIFSPFPPPGSPSCRLNLEVRMSAMMLPDVCQPARTVRQVCKHAACCCAGPRASCRDATAARHPATTWRRWRPAPTPQLPGTPPPHPLTQHHSYSRGVGGYSVHSLTEGTASNKAAVESRT